MGMSDCQSYEYKELQQQPNKRLYGIRGKWRTFKGSEIVFTDAWKEFNRTI